MGAKLGCVILDTPRADVVEEVVELATRECERAGVELADLFAATAVRLAPYFAGAPDRRVAVFGLRTEPAGPGADALAQAVGARLRVGSMTAFVNDLYCSGGYQIWSPDREALLVDFQVVLGEATVTYLDAPRLGIARLLRIDPTPAPEHRLALLERLTWADGLGTDLRILEGGRALRPPRPLREDEALEWSWRSAEMAWPMMEGAARRQRRPSPSR